MTIKATVNILEKDTEINREIMKLLLPQVSKLFSKAAKRIERRVPNIIESAIVSQPEYAELISGVLKEEFGIPNAASKIEQLLAIWKKINVEYDAPRIKGSQIVGGISVTAIRSDYSDVLNTGAALQKTEKGGTLPWLDWLLRQGDRVIIKEYEIVIGDGRAGDKVMRKNIKGKWGVPKSFVGTPNNNWVTRAITSVSSVLDRTIKEALET